MRICSLVPGATEVLFALGLGESVVGVTHECDWPHEAESRPRVTASHLQSGDLSSAEIDEAVAEAAREGKALYAVDEAVWEEIQADVVVAQELCDVCAVSAGEVRRLDVEVIDYSPATLDGVLGHITALGWRLDAEAAADELTNGMRLRLERVRAALAETESYPRVYVSEWLEPPYAAGHWVPDMVSAGVGWKSPGLPASRRFGCAGRTSRGSSPTPSSSLRAASTSTGRSARSSRSTSARTSLARQRDRRAACSPWTRTAISPGRAPGSSTASSCSPTSSIRTHTPIRASRGRASGCDDDLVALNLDPEHPGRLVAVEAGSAVQVELPPVEGAREGVAEDLALVQRVALVRTGVGEGVSPAVDDENGDLRAFDFDERAAVPIEARERDPHRLHAA